MSWLIEGRLAARPIGTSAPGYLDMAGRFAEREAAGCGEGADG